MSAEIYPIHLAADRNSKPEDCSMTVFRPVAQPDLTMDHIGTAPCEHVWSDSKNEN